MKFATLALLATVASAAGDMEVSEACACLDAEDIPVDFIVGEGYPETYGVGCGVHDAAEDYCVGPPPSTDEWCEETYSWCYVSIECEWAEETVFFADTDYADTLAYSVADCKDAATRVILSALSVAAAATALSM